MAALGQLRLLAVALVACGLLATGGCQRAASEDARPGPLPTRAEAPVTGFQAALDRHGIGLTLPAEGKAIVVNVPAFELIAFEDAELVMRSRIIVGTPRTPTPLIDTYTSAVRFRPSWRPTPSMVARGEYPDRRWPPGPRNPLGLAAVRLEPGLLVYLHDTNRPELFDREARALSHGCIRVQRWDDLVAWLLDIDPAAVHRHAEGRRTFDMPTPPVPVLIRYHTRFPSDDGTLRRYPDVYRRGTAQRGEGTAPATVGCAPTARRSDADDT